MQNKARGQALAETLVVLAAMVPMVFLGFWVAKVADMQLATGAAARKIAYECARRATECEGATPQDMVSDARIHAFGTLGREVLTGDHPDDSTAGESSNPFWVDHKGAPLLVQFSDVSGAVATENFDATASLIKSQSIKGAVHSAAEIVSNLAGPGRFGFDTFGGLINAKVQTKIASDRAPLGKAGRLDPFPLTASRQVALLTDQWNATGANNGRADATQQRVNQGMRLPFVNKAGEDAAKLAYGLTIFNINAVDLLPNIEPSASTFKLHRTDVSVIPPDRVAPKPTPESP